MAAENIIIGIQYLQRRTIDLCCC